MARLVHQMASIGRQMAHIVRRLAPRICIWYLDPAMPTLASLLFIIYTCETYTSSCIAYHLCDYVEAYGYTVAVYRSGQYAQQNPALMVLRLARSVLSLLSATLPFIWDDRPTEILGHVAYSLSQPPPPVAYKIGILLGVRLGAGWSKLCTYVRRRPARLMEYLQCC